MSKEEEASDADALEGATESTQKITTTTTEARKRGRKASVPRCGLGADVCRGRLSLAFGPCKFCGVAFCTAHRLPEQHACAGIAGCRQQARDRLAKQTPGTVAAAKVTSIGTSK